MNVASHADILCAPHALAARAATSRLDRSLAPLADLGAAIRDEIVQSLAPMATELETARNLLSMLEVRVRDLETRLAATADPVSDPGLPPHATRHAVEKPPMSTPEPVFPRAVVIDSEGAGDASPNPPESAAADEAQTGLAAATGTASLGPQAHDPGPLSAATGAVAEQRTRAEAPTHKKKPRKAAVPKSGAGAPAPAVTITVVLAPGASATAATVSMALMPFPPMNAATVSVSVSVTVAATEPAASAVDTPGASGSTSSQPAPGADLQGQASVADERAEFVPATSEPSVAAALPDGDAHAGMPPEAADAMACERAAKVLHPLLEKGAREVIAFGLYPDMAALLDEAVFRLLETDYPADPDG